MVHIHIKIYTEKEIEYVDVSITGPMDKKVKLIHGESYLVEPINPVKQKHRGRHCTIKSFRPDCVRVQFHDTKRVGSVCYSDLIKL